MHIKLTSLQNFQVKFKSMAQKAYVYKLESSLRIGYFGRCISNVYGPVNVSGMGSLNRVECVIPAAVPWIKCCNLGSQG